MAKAKKLPAAYGAKTYAAKPAAYGAAAYAKKGKVKRGRRRKIAAARLRKKKKGLAPPYGYGAV